MREHEQEMKERADRFLAEAQASHDRRAMLGRVFGGIDMREWVRMRSELEASIADRRRRAVTEGA